MGVPVLFAEPGGKWLWVSSTRRAGSYVPNSPPSRVAVFLKPNSDGMERNGAYGTCNVPTNRSTELQTPWGPGELLAAAGVTDRIQPPGIAGTRKLGSCSSRFRRWFVAA